MRDADKFDSSAFNTYISLMNQIQRQLEFIAKIFGKIHDAPKTAVVENKTMIINKTMEINETIKQLENMGYVIAKEEDLAYHLRMKGYRVYKPPTGYDKRKEQEELETYLKSQVEKRKNVA